MIRTFVFIFGLLLPAALWASSEVHDLPAPSGGTQRMLLLKPERPIAVLVVFAGGDRALGIAEDGSLEWGSASLLIRTLPLFLQHGFVAAIVDLPSAQQAKPNPDFRVSAAHARDISTVIDFLRRDSKLPVWLIGTSSGTTSVLNAAMHLQKNGADGIVVTSGIDPSMNSQLGAIRVPVLVVRKGDPCDPVQRDPSGTIAALANAPKAEEVIVQSSVEVGADPCSIAPRHGFLGMESQFVNKIANWIKTVLQQKNYI